MGEAQLVAQIAFRAAGMAVHYRQRRLDVGGVGNHERLQRLGRHAAPIAQHLAVLGLGAPGVEIAVGEGIILHHRRARHAERGQRTSAAATPVRSLPAERLKARGRGRPAAP